MNPTEHLPPELLFGYQHHLLTPEELRSVHDHVSVCDFCRDQLADKLHVDGTIRDLRSSLALEQKTVSRPFLTYIAAAAALVLAVSGSIWLLRRSSSQLDVYQGGDEAPAVRAALRAGRIALPAFLGELAPSRETLMGPGGAVSPHVLTPRATAVLGPSVRFEWSPLPGHWTYQVRIYRLGGELMLTSPEIPDAQWIASRAIPPNNDYQWQVIATRGEERVTLPQPPENPPRFRILDAALSEQLRKSARANPEAHLLLGVEYGQAGAVDEARAALLQAVRENANADAARRLLGKLPAAH